MAARVWVPYVSDNGTTYQRKTLDDVATALGITAEALGAHARLPSNIEPRYILAMDATTGRSHKLVGLPPSDAMFTGTDNTITVPDPNNRGGATIALNIAARVGEKRYVR